MTARVTTVIVNYNGGELVRRCVESLALDPYTAQSPVIVVDNGSSDGSVEALRLPERGPEVVETGSNRGFGAANNVAIDICETPYALMLNPDTELREGDLGELLGRMDADPALALVGCRIVDPEGGLQRSMHNQPTVLRELYEALFLHRLFRSAADRLADTVQSASAYAAPRDVDWVSGAAMVARTSALREVGGFDEGFFLYAEETDLCTRLKDAGWKVGYDPSLTVTHVGGVYAVDPALALEHQRSKLRYFLKHEGRAGMLAVAGVVMVRLAIRSLLWRLGGSDVDGMSRKRSRAALSTLRAYPALVREFLSMPRPAPVAPRNEGEVA